MAVIATILVLDFEKFSSALTDLFVLIVLGLYLTGDIEFKFKSKS